ncbi:MAG: choice-of-anchor Q domain-containing protein [Anaerolineales bacterium]|nr:choice-of-anchor Q domain-containing protein [Anaerolineales bacterium]
MNSKLRFFLIGAFTGLGFLLSSCTPIPNCGTADYHVTKEEDTFDGVCSAGDCSLREAVHNANACPGQQTIHLPAGGYHLTRSGIDEDAAETGDLDITDDLIILGSGAPSVHGDGDRAFHIFSPAVVEMDLIYLVDGEAILGAGLLNESTLTLTNFTCNYNHAVMPPGGMGDARGGCIFNGGELTVNNAHLLENSARLGGGIYNFDNSSLEINGGVLIGNRAEDLGGGLWIGPNTTVDIHDLTFRLNSAGLHGGGIWNRGSTTIQQVTMEENDAMGNGGALYNWNGGQMTLTAVWLHANAADQGGAVYNEDGMVHLYQSSVTENIAAGGTGGGFTNQGAASGLLLRNTTISGNIVASGGSGGGGIYNTGNLRLEFITLTENNQGGIQTAGGTERTIRSSVLANNTGGNCTGSPLDSLGYNVDSDGTCGLVGLDDLSPVDPLLLPQGMNGGIGPSHQLGTGSPALDTGDPDRCLAHDQRGISRPQGVSCDRGALEMEGGLGSISGWTYIDTNRNNLKEPGEGTISGATLSLKEGACPGGTELEVVDSDSSGSYQMLNLPAGSYCVQTSPFQQTLYPENHTVNLSPGENLGDLNFRYLLSPLGEASIQGLVWHDLCAVPEGTYTTPPPGCVEISGRLTADGVYNPSEPGIAGVQVVLKGGFCFSAPAAIVTTDSNGEFYFPNLSDGLYCLSIDALSPPNDSILIPGEWTAPVRGAQPIEVEITLGPAEDLAGQNFGWDYQFLPVPPPAPLPASRGFFGMNGFCRKGPGTVYDTVTAFEEGKEVEIEGRSEHNLPLWWYIRDLKLDLSCWVSDLILETEADPERIPTVIAPPTPTPTLTPTPLACSRDLPKDQCEASGGTWFTPTSYQGDPYCVCP